MGVFTINNFRKVTIAVRVSVKFIVLTILAIFLIISITVLFYHPTYSVTLNGEVIGYTADKSNLQSRINKYISANEEENIAFVQVDAMPTYKLCLLKNGISTNDEEIFEKVKGVIVEQLDVAEGNITMKASFIDDLGADSLDIVELIMALEEEFDIEIPDSDAEKVVTVGDVVEYIKDHVA